jgi:SAM-dependent methyltransferase
MSLGVLHHIPDTQKAMLDIARKLKPGGTFLCYLYYKVEDKPFAYRVIFHLTDFIRMVISRLPHFLRMSIAKIIAAVIYLPLARYAAMHMKWGKDVSNIPLHHYAKMPFIMLENDALDRFGTRLEQRFNKDEITSMLSKSGFDLNTLKFSEVEPYWTFLISLK